MQALLRDAGRAILPAIVGILAAADGAPASEHRLPRATLALRVCGDRATLATVAEAAEAGEAAA